MGITVRPARESDLEWLLGQLKAFSRFFGTKTQLFEEEDTDYARATIGAMVRDHFVLIAERADLTPLGFIAAWKTPHPFKPKLRVLSETFWWVSEEHRGSRAALVLLNAFVEYGRENCDWVCIALEAHSPVNEKCLHKRGFRLQERSYLLEVG